MGMVVSTKYAVMDMEKGTLDRRIFTDEQVYQDELEQVFGRAWLNIAHESLVPDPNDFFLSYMGEDPVIVTRDTDDKLNAITRAVIDQEVCLERRER
jgi:phenylpropionate dioxygenase-like ring-hydroxylating dioxygenase large terminal subunit